MTSRSLFDKIWDAHVVESPDDGRPAVLYIDLHLIHEVTSPQAFSVLRENGLRVRRPDRTLGTLDHSTPTLPRAADGTLPYLDAATRAQVVQLERNSVEFGINLRGWDSPDRGIVHVMAPELGRTQPGMTIVCGDSHTSTHGAFGALAFGIGTTEVGHVLATQCLLQRKPKSLAVTIEGTLPAGVSAKDLTLHVVGTLGVDGGSGHVIEFRGSTVRALSMEQRMTLCNMSIEMGARAGMVAPDATTVEWLRGSPAGRGLREGGAGLAGVRRRSRRTLRSRGAHRRQPYRADRDLGHRSRQDRGDQWPPAWRARCRDAQGARLHAPARRPGHRRRAGRRGVRRQLHQLAPVRPA
jgi:3-isopropylmalate/(R)-2-methylmalate dehydratase large subunit